MRSAGTGIGSDGADIGAAGVAERVAAHRRAGTGDDEAAELADDLVTVTMPPAVAQHGQVRSQVGDDQRLAEDVGALKVNPLDGVLTRATSVPGGGAFVGPRRAEGVRVAWSGLLGEVGHRRSFRLVEGWWVLGAGAQGDGRSARKRRRRRLLETTKTLERPIEAPAMSGLSSPAAARGMAATL